MDFGSQFTEIHYLLYLLFVFLLLRQNKSEKGIIIARLKPQFCFYSFFIPKFKLSFAKVVIIFECKNKKKVKSTFVSVFMFNFAHYI